MKRLLFSVVTVLLAAGVVSSTGCVNRNASYDEYLDTVAKTNAYYAADAMMNKIIIDLSEGADIYELNRSDPSRYNNQSAAGYCQGCSVSTFINISSLCSSLDSEGQDYEITTTAFVNGSKLASITACLRQTPGSGNGSKPHTLEITSWEVTYH